MVGCEFVNGKGEVVTLRPGDETLNGAVVSYGALGIMTKMTLKVVPTFACRQTVYSDVSLDQVVGY